jgi:antitoxin ParD1/3/4
MVLPIPTMSKVEKISIALTDEMLASVKAAVASGDYASSSEVIRHALRDWKGQRERETAHLHALVAEGLKGPFELWEGAEALKQEFRELRAKRGA